MITRNIQLILILVALVLSSACRHNDAALHRRDERSIFLPASVVAGYAEMDRRNSQLRTFALKKKPSLWSRVQSLRANLDVQEEKVVHARERLVRMDRIPEQDNGYVRLCQERYRLALLLRELFNEIEEAYLEAALYEDSLGEKGFKPTQDDQQEGVDDARMLQHYYRELLNKK